MTTFYIVRHGESDGNIQQTVQGHTESSLTPKGLEQAKSLAQDLEKVNFDIIFSSDSLRAKETAKIIGSLLNIPIKTTRKLRERTQGKFEGMKTNKFLGLYSEWNTLTHKEKLAHKFDDSQESFDDAMRRFNPFLKKVAKEYDGKIVLVVTHGGIIRGFLINQGYGDFDNIGGIANCGYIKVLYKNNKFFISETNGLKTWKENIPKN